MYFMYIIDFFKIKELESFIWTNFFNNIWIFKVYVFVMFKMKYFINKM